MWGGAGNILVPFDETTGVPDSFWRLLRVFDPDYVAVFRPTYASWREADPSAFEQWFENYARAFAEQNKIDLPTVRAELSNESLFASTIYDGCPPDIVKERTRLDLSILPQSESHYWFTVKPQREIDWPFVDMCQFAAHDQRPIPSVSVEGAGNLVAQVLGFRLGLLSKAHEALLQRHGVSVEALSIPRELLTEALHLGWSGKMRTHLHLLAAPQTSAALDEHLRQLEGLDLATTPSNRTLFGCGRYQDIYKGPDYLPFIVVVGDTIEDLCLAWTVDRLWKPAALVSPSILKGEDELSRAARQSLAMVIAEQTGYGDPTRRALLTSLSLGPEELCDARHRVANSLLIDSLAIEESLKLTLPQELPLQKADRIYDVHALDLSRFDPFLENVHATAVDTPVPSILRDRVALDLRWQVDIAVDRYQIPIRSCLNELLVDQPGEKRIAIRTSADGISYDGRNRGFAAAGALLHQKLARPRIRLPTASEVFAKLFLAAGLKAQTSSAGQFLKGTLQLWGGLDRLAADMSSASVNPLLEAYRNERGRQKPGCYIQQLARRFLTFDDSSAVTKLEESELRAVLDRFVAARILERGFLLHCDQCSYAGWYRPKDIGRRFRCGRCRALRLVTREAWKKPVTEPSWYYAMNEIAFQAVDQNARVVVLGLEELRNHARAFDFAAPMDVLQGNNLVGEVDLLALADGRIIVGEAKSNGKLGKTAEEERHAASKLRRVAEAATADMIVFATTEENWSDATMANVSEAFKGSSIAIRWMSALGTSSA